MNFLAHIFLSENDDKVMVGNFIADSVKGKSMHDFPDEIKTGIKLHRFIDSYTDSHPIVEESKRRLRENYRKYAGVIVDVFYDHFLAVHWDQYHQETLEPFVESTYRTLLDHNEILPDKTQFMLPYMVKHNWLLSYRETLGIGRALSGLARRTSFQSNMEYAVGDLERHYSAYEKEFSSFFPELISASRDKLISLRDELSNE